MKTLTMRTLARERARTKIAMIIAGITAILWATAPVMATPAVVGQTGMTGAETERLFKEANELFRQANEQAGVNTEAARDLYGKAAMRFERIIAEGGIKNGRLYYDLGNTYFRMKDIGRAILNYRRAEQYIPNDPQLQQNLRYACERRLDRIEEKQRTKVLRTLFFWHYDLSAESRTVLFAVSFLMVWILASIRLFRPGSPLGWGIILAAALSTLLLGSLASDAVTLHRVRPGVIISVETVARKGDSETYEPSFKDSLHAGTEFTLIENRGHWRQVELADSRQCWVLAADSELVR